ncbi:MAG: efflux RND transporter periplasmic adaptor subunit [Saprospiraceae bacterium]|nr:efflux RND transporter periplasmic adaptor subunit [Saprospiraceae bacterium]
MKTYIHYTFMLVLAALFIQACSESKANSENSISKKAIPVRVMKLEKQNWNSEVKASGSITSDDETLLSFKTGGIISEILVSEGDYIRKGQLLARLDLTEINASVNQAKLAHAKALRDYERVQRLKLEDAATLEQEENTKTGLDLAVQQLQVAQFNLQHSEIRSAQNGYVLKKLANPGQISGPGTPVFQTISSNSSAWKLRVGVTDREWALIKEGDLAFIHSDLISDEKIQSKVIKKSRTADLRGGSFTVDLAIPSSLLKKAGLGMIASATITPSTKENCWMIPYEALLDSDKGNGYVFTLGKDQKVQKIKVKTGKLDHDKIQVLEGLENQTSIVVSGSAYLKDGSEVSIIQ